MIWWIILIEMAAFAALFTTILFIYYKKIDNPSPATIHNYPPDIQEEYFKTHERVEVSYKSSNVVLTKGIGIVIFTIILLLCSIFANAKTFLDGFLLTFGLMIWIGIYDTFFIDWILFANMKRFRLKGTEHMDKAYHQKWFHLKGMLFPGLVFALIPAIIVGLIVMFIH